MLFVLICCDDGDVSLLLIVTLLSVRKSTCGVFDGDRGGKPCVLALLSLPIPSVLDILVSVKGSDFGQKMVI